LVRVWRRAGAGVGISAGGERRLAAVGTNPAPGDGFEGGLLGERGGHAVGEAGLGVCGAGRSAPRGAANARSDGTLPGAFAVRGDSGPVRGGGDADVGTFAGGAPDRCGPYGLCGIFVGEHAGGGSGGTQRAVQGCGVLSGWGGWAGGAGGGA